MTIGHDIKGTSYCEFYNGTACPESQPGCIEREECSPSEPDKRNHCYVVWKYDRETKKSTAVLKVCSLLIFTHYTLDSFQLKSLNDKFINKYHDYYHINLRKIM